MQALFKLSKKKISKKKIITLTMLARSPERIFRIENIRLLEEANAYILHYLLARLFSRKDF